MEKICYLIAVGACVIVCADLAAIITGFASFGVQIEVHAVVALDPAVVSREFDVGV